MPVRRTKLDGSHSRLRWTIEDTVQRTMQWYKRFASGEDARTLCLNDIAAFEACE